MAIRGELKDRNGVTKEITIRTENNLPSLECYVRIKKLPRGLLTELVAQEKLISGDNTHNKPEQEAVDGEIVFCCEIIVA